VSRAAGVDRLGGAGMATMSMASDAVDGEDGAVVGKAVVSTGGDGVDGSQSRSLRQWWDRHCLDDE